MNQSEGHSTNVTGLPQADRSHEVQVAPGETYHLKIHPVGKRIGDETFRMLSYNGSIPGPTLRVNQGSDIFVNVTNETDMDTTVHWHGLRLENRYDGVPHDTQSPIPPRGTYTHHLTFPDAGLFWYHPHMREDYAQEMGLYGNVLVSPVDADYWPSVDQEVVVTLDDILIEDGHIAAFDQHHANFAAMGRFGNVLLISGETDQEFKVRKGEVLRFYLTNTANTRVFKLALPEGRMKLVGSDGGHYEHEEWVEDVVVAPSERAIVDVLFEKSGHFTLDHVTPDRRYQLAAIDVIDDPGWVPTIQFDALRTNDDMVAERQRVAGYLDAAPDKTLALVAEMDVEEPEPGVGVRYLCPMHAEVTSEQPGQCPKCGMKLMPQAFERSRYACPMHPEVVSAEPGHCPKCGMKLLSIKTAYTCPMHPEVISPEPGPCPKCGMKLMPSIAVPRADITDQHVAEPSAHGQHDHREALADGIEWEDSMVEMNRETTSANMRWELIDRATGKANQDIDWVFQHGDQVKIRIVNEMESDHPMHHPFHIHGQRFLVLARDGVAESNLVWKDTVLVRTGEVVDILMDASNPGLWMAHCHIAEHMESGMMFDFRVLAAS